LTLGVWVALVVLFTVRTDRAFTEYNVPPPYLRQDGVPRFGSLTLFVVSVLLLLSPALTARSVNGPRGWNSPLAPPADRPSPAAIAVGTLLGGWAVGLVALALAAVLPHHHELAGRPLESHEVVVQTIAATTTRTGLTVKAMLDDNSYPTGLRITDAQMRQLLHRHIKRHDFHGDWNYDVMPTAADDHEARLATPITPTRPKNGSSFSESTKRGCTTTPHTTTSPALAVSPSITVRPPRPLSRLT
jgi:hypothetical protein